MGSLLTSWSSKKPLKEAETSSSSLNCMHSHRGLIEVLIKGTPSFLSVPSGELLESIVAENNLTEAVAVGYLTQLLSAVDTLHRIKIAHLDIRVSHMTSHMTYHMV